jgi:hypothetical protein
MDSHDATRKGRSSRFSNALWLTAALLTTLLMAGLVAKDARAEDDDDEDAIPLDVTEIYFELNNTDGDLGIHALIDGEPWKKLEMEGPHERELLEIIVRSRLRRQGLTELFFESAEPNFDDLDPKDFFRRFPEGEYEVDGKTLEGEELEGTTEVTHLLPAPPVIFVNGVKLPDDCDEDPGPEVSEPLIVTWDPITMSHPEIGRTSEEIEVTGYQVVVEQEERPFKATFDVPPDVMELVLPVGLLEPGEVKIEVLAREESHNQTATESCFVVD